MEDVRYSLSNIILSVLFAGVLGGIVMFIPQLIWGRMIISKMLFISGYDPINHVPNLIPLFFGCIIFGCLMTMVLSIIGLIVVKDIINAKIGFYIGLACFYIFCVSTNFRTADVLPNTIKSDLEWSFILWWLGSVLMSGIGFYLLFNSNSAISRMGGIIFMVLPLLVGGTSKGTDLSQILPVDLYYYHLIKWISLLCFWVISGLLWGILISYLRTTNLYRYKQ